MAKYQATRPDQHVFAASTRVEKIQSPFSLMGNLGLGIYSIIFIYK